jgi:hypothetical protein
MPKLNNLQTASLKKMLLPQQNLWSHHHKRLPVVPAKKNSTSQAQILLEIWIKSFIT